MAWQSVRRGWDPVLTPLQAPWRAGAAILLTVLASRYLPWRLGTLWHPPTPLAAVLSVLLLVAELMILGHGLLQVWLGGLGGSDGRREIEEGAAWLAELRHSAPERLPSVAVLVPTCGEPTEVITRCLEGCLALDYPKAEVWLLDDSGRRELGELCGRLGVRYLARSQRLHAKAGNLNHALQHLQADLIAVFDADVVPLASFLSRTVGLFSSPDVGFVQTPQTYMGADPVMRNLRLERWLMADEESFYRWIEPTRQRLGAVVCAGTSFVMRRLALMEVGGFETGTTSEDLATGIRLVAAGHRGLYVAEKLSAGLPPLTIGAMAVQRCRWASGTLQILRTGANPLTIPGLNPLQRLAFAEGILHWLLVFPFLVLALAPLALGLVNLTPLQVVPRELLVVAVPFYLAQLLLIRWLSDQSRSALMPELYRWLLASPLAITVLASLCGQPARFRVTPKGGGIARGVGPNRDLLRPLLGFLAGQLLAIALLIRDLLQRPLPGAASLMALGLGWALLNSLFILVAIRSCWDRPREDATPWLAPRLGGGLLGPEPSTPIPVRLLAISEVGCEVRGPAGLQGAQFLRLDHPLFEGEALPVRLVCLSRPGNRAEGPGLGLRWGELTADHQSRLQHFLYRRPHQWPDSRAPWDPLAVPALVDRLLRPVPPEGWFCRSLLPVR